MFFRKKPEKAEFLKLVDEMESILGRRATAGGNPSPQDAPRLSQIESRLIQLVSTNESESRRKNIRLFCRLAVKVHSPGGVFGGTVVDIGAGGVFITTECVAEKDSQVLLEVDQAWATFSPGEKLPGKVAWFSEPNAARRGIGVAFDNIERELNAKLRLLVLHLLKNQVRAL